MVLPFISSVTMREVLLTDRTAQVRLKESAYALGSTTWEVVRKVVLPYIRTGVDRRRSCWAWAARSARRWR